MFHEVLTAKIHRARVTETELAYTGSLTLDPDLLDAANVHPHEKVQVVNVTNGERLVTYAIEGERGSGTVCLNGAAARLGEVGDTVIVLAFGLTEEPRRHDPTIVTVDEQNRVLEDG